MGRDGHGEAAWEHAALPMGSVADHSRGGPAGVPIIGWIAYDSRGRERA
jgi:hypothetical protein